MGGRGVRSLGVSALVSIVALVAPAAVFGAETPVAATAPYELDFTLPSDASSGCQVCHGDPALVRIRDGVITSYYIDSAAIAASSHANEQCVGCHLDFTYKAPHTAGAWDVVAKTACRNCHEQQGRDVGVGVHRASTTSADGATASAETTPAPKPLCGDCHGSHGIPMLTDNPAGRAALHADGWNVCGRCHEDYWESYNDYYHGAAYKRGAEDAPACWDCHGWHDILPSTERGSRVHESHLVETCGQTGCHVGVDERYAEYATFIHGRNELAAANPVHRAIRSVAGFVSRIFGGGR